MAVSIKMKVVWDVTLYKLDIKFQRTLTLKMEAAGSSEILILIYQNAWNQITEDCS
jgi:hypothetical protein